MEIVDSAAKDRTSRSSGNDPSALRVVAEAAMLIAVIIVFVSMFFAIFNSVTSHVRAADASKFEVAREADTVRFNEEMAQAAGEYERIEAVALAEARLEVGYEQSASMSTAAPLSLQVPAGAGAYAGCRIGAEVVPEVVAAGATGRPHQIVCGGLARHVRGFVRAPDGGPLRVVRMPDLLDGGKGRVVTATIRVTAGERVAVWIRKADLAEAAR